MKTSDTLPKPVATGWHAPSWWPQVSPPSKLLKNRQDRPFRHFDESRNPETLPTAGAGRVRGQVDLYKQRLKLYTLGE